MNYTSTRNSSISVTAAEAIVQGISDEGGLFVPVDLNALPKFDMQRFIELAAKDYQSYQDIAYDIFKPLFDFTPSMESELRNCVNNAYSANFNTVGTTRVVKLDDSGKGAAHILELWHGPTAAFKDMALQVLPGVMNLSKVVLKRGGEKTLILVATSGDTGKAALEGFKDAQGIEIAVFYPEDGVSEMQKLQMITQEGENVHVFAVKGNFDDCQAALKDVFTDMAVIDRAKQNGVSFSSANSINWGRLFPQIVYYIHAYVELIRTKAIKAGDKINVCVPTGNFGNILAAYYASVMGLPVNKFICASNSNNVLADFINTGVYDRNREFCATVSPSMDILVSSNLERLLYHFADGDSSAVNKWFAALKDSGKFEVDGKVKAKIDESFFGGWCNESETSSTIKSVFAKYGYLMDTHTAVGYKVWQDYVEQSGDRKTKTLIAATANPYKFAGAVYESLYGAFIPAELTDFDGGYYPEEYIETPSNPDDDALSRLSSRSGIRVPATLKGVREKEVRFNQAALEKGQIKEAILKIIK